MKLLDSRNTFEDKSIHMIFKILMRIFKMIEIENFRSLTEYMAKMSPICDMEYLHFIKSMRWLSI